MIMATRKRHSPEQVVRKLTTADRLLAEGKDVAAVCRELGVGTVTTGKMSLIATHPASGTDPDEPLLIAGALEAGSEHPIAAAVRARFGDLPPVADYANSAGLGVTGTVTHTGSDRRHLYFNARSDSGRPRSGSRCR